jgi:MFS family permease
VKQPILTRAFGLLCAAHFLQALGFSSMLLLPLYLAHLGASRTEVGAIMAAASIGGLAGRPLVGWALDVVGRKPVLILGTITLVAGMAMVGAVTRIGPLAYLMRVCVGLGAGTLFAGYFTLAADIVPVSRRTEGLALFGISGLVPLLVNPFADRLGIQPEQVRWFLPMVGVLVLCSLPFLIGVPEPTTIRRPEHVRLRSALGALAQRNLWPVWLATTTFAALVAVFMSFMTVIGDARGVEHPAGVWLTYACGAVAVRALGASLPERVGTGRVGGVALSLYATGMLVAASATSEEGFLAAGLLAGIGHGYCFPVLTGQVVTRSPDALRGVALAAFTGLWEVARLVAAPSFGAIADRWGDTAMLQTAFLMGVAGVGGWFLLEQAMPQAGGRTPGQGPPDPPLTHLQQPTPDRSRRSRRIRSTASATPPPVSFVASNRSVACRATSSPA